MKRLFAIGLCAAGMLACEPAPDRVALASRTDPVGAVTELQEGDLLVLDAKTMEDEDEDEQLCVNASVLEGSSATVHRVRDQCRRFVILATGAGRTSLRFEARGTTTDIVIDVAPARSER